MATSGEGWIGPPGSNGSNPDLENDHRRPDGRVVGEVLADPPWWLRWFGVWLDSFRWVSTPAGRVPYMPDLVTRAVVIVVVSPIIVGWAKYRAWRAST